MHFVVWSVTGGQECTSKSPRFLAKPLGHIKMTTKIITILLGLAILILGLNYGSPIEITFQPGHRIGTLILAVLIGITFYFLLRQSLKIKPQWLKILGLGLTGIVFL